jgi:hypothetical protein
VVTHCMKQSMFAALVRDAEAVKRSWPSVVMSSLGRGLLPERRLMVSRIRLSHRHDGAEITPPPFDCQVPGGIQGEWGRSIRGAF